MSLELVVRKFESRDIFNLIRLTNESQPLAKVEDRQATSRWLFDFLSNPGGTVYLLAELNNELVGYILGQPLTDLRDDKFLLDFVGEDEKLFCLETVYVKEGHRRQKFGTKLYESLIQYAKTKGYTRMITYNVNSELSYLALYRSLGRTEEKFKDLVIFKERIE